MKMTVPHRVEPPEHWLNAQRLAMGLNLLNRRDPNSPNYHQLLTITFNYLPQPYDKNTFQTIHPATLRAFIEINRNRMGEWQKYQGLGLIAYNELQSYGSNHLSRLAGAKLVANRIMTTNTRASQIAETAQTEMAIEAPWPNEAIEPLQEFMEKVRRWNLPTQDRLISLAYFKKTLKERGISSLDLWELVENALLQQWFIWPLLIFENEANEGTALSVPLALDVSLNQYKSVELIEEHGFFKYDDSFMDSFYKSRKAACELWKNKHMSWPPTFIKHVESLKVSIDLIASELIIEPYSDFLPEEIILKGGSAGLYFSLAILSKQVDPAAMEGVCASGIIGSRRHDTGGGADYILESPGNLQSKINYAGGCYLFDTFLTASSKQQDLEAENQAGHLRVVNVPTSDRWRKKALSEAANVVFHQKWRKHQYVRAADLAIFFKPKNKSDRYTGNPPEQAVEDVLEKIKKSKDPVLQLDNTNPHDVAKALYCINHKIYTFASESEIAKNVGTTAFVRLVLNEINERLWQTVWHVIDGDIQSLNDFLFASTTEIAAKIFAAEMNKRPENQPWRAPDVLVLVGSDGEPHSTAIPNGPFTRHKIVNLVPHLNEKLQKTRVKMLREHLGNTRLILVPHDQPNSIQQCQAPEHLCPDLHAKVAKLSVFQFGFTQEMARRMWRISDAECEQLLKQGMDRGLLEYAEGAGEYIVCIAKNDNNNRQVIAKYHYEAAQAIIGLLNPERDARRLNLTESLSPHWLHEAQWHLQQVRRKGGKLHPVNFAIDRLDRLGEWFSWTRVRWAIQRLREQRAGILGEDDELVKGATALLNASIEHFKELREQKIFLRNTHPMDFMYCATLAAELAKHLRRKRKDLYQQRDQFLAQACKRIKKHPDFDLLEQAEKDACSYVLQTSKACMHCDEICTNFADNGADYKRIQEIWEENKDIAKSCAEYEYEILDRRWFEYMGDAANDHKAAIFFYKRGILNPNISALPSIVVKYLGCAAIIGERVSNKVSDAILKVKNKELAIPQSIPCFYFLSGVQDRWKTGKTCYFNYGLD